MEIALALGAVWLLYPCGYQLHLGSYHSHGSGARFGQGYPLTFGELREECKYPHWNGDWGTYQDYDLRVELKADATRQEELEQLGPRLVGNLLGKAFEAIADIERGELKTKTGWKNLLRHLEKKRGKETVDLLGGAFTEFFVRQDAHRKDREELSDYALRFSALVRKLDRAVKESGSEGRIPQELHGWFLLSVYMKMDASDIANVRGRADSYRLEHVLQALNRMWSEGGLSQKDAENKKENGHAFMNAPDMENEEYPNDDFNDDSHYGDEDDDDYELEAATEWYHEGLAAFLQNPEDENVFASYQEARRALEKARTSRGDYPVRNPNQNFQAKGQRGKGFGKGKGSANVGGKAGGNKTKLITPTRSAYDVEDGDTLLKVVLKDHLKEMPMVQTGVGQLHQGPNGHLVPVDE